MNFIDIPKLNNLKKNRSAFTISGMKFKLYFTLTILSVLFGTLVAEEEPFFQLNHYAQRSWRSVNGLAHDNVTAIYKDKAGFVWAGTIEGLSRIDGTSSKTFTARTHPQMLSNRIVAVEGFSEDTLYVATAMGISRFFENRFDKVIEETGILSMTVTENGVIYASKGTEILSIYHKEINRLSIVNGMPEGNVLSIDSYKDALFAGNSAGSVFSYSKGAFSQNLCELNKLPVTAISAQEDRVVFGNAEGKLFVIRNGDCSVLAADPLKNNETGAVKSISGTKDSIRAITDNYLIFVEGIDSRYVKNCCGIPGIPSSVLYDEEQKMWISGNNGLSLFYKGTFVTLGKDEGLSSEMVYAMVEDNDGKVWVGSRGGGLFYYSDGTFKQVPAKAGIKSQFIGGLMLDDAGSIWAGTSKGIITFSSKLPIKVKEVPTNKKGTTPLASVIFQDSKKRIWAGTADGAIYLFVKGSFSFIRQVGSEGEDFISAITEDKEGKLWFATSSGLLLFDKDFFKMISLKEGLSDNLVLSLHADSSGIMFAGMMRTGLSIIMPDGKIISLNTKKGLCSDTIYSIIPDSNGNLWFTSTQGIFALKKDLIIETAKGSSSNLACSQFDSQDGIKRSENTGGVQPSSMIRRNGELWFPTVEGIAAVRGGSTHPSSSHIVIDEILADGKSLKISDTLMLQGSVSLFEIKYTASRFIHPERLNIRYKLEPFDEEWTNHSEKKTANYQKIPSGVYTFMIEAVDESGGVQKRSFGVTIENNSVFSNLDSKYILILFLVLAASAGIVLVAVSKRRKIKPVERTIEEIPEKQELIQDVEPISEVPATEFQEVVIPENQAVEQFCDLNDNTAEDDSPKYEKSRLDEEVAQAYAKELKDLMETQKPYKNPELTMPELAKQLNLSANILSQVINGHCKLNFYSFVNIYRTEAVIEMMKDDFYKERSILDLAYDAGFKSKTTFNTIFKKHTGFTPSEFRKNIDQNSKNQENQ